MQRLMQRPSRSRRMRFRHASRRWISSRYYTTRAPISILTLPLRHLPPLRAKIRRTTGLRNAWLMRSLRQAAARHLAVLIHAPSLSSPRRPPQGLSHSMLRLCRKRLPAGPLLHPNSRRPVVHHPSSGATPIFTPSLLKQVPNTFLREHPPPIYHLKHQ